MTKLKNPIWSTERALGEVVFATIASLREMVEGQKTHVNFVWPDEGDFLKFGNNSTFKQNEETTAPPLLCRRSDARKILYLYDQAASAANKTKLEAMVSRNRGSFAKVFDAAFSFCEQQGFK